MQKKVSVIIPLAPGEIVLPKLCSQLAGLPKEWEVLICSSQKPDQDFLSEGFRYTYTQKGRANSLNEGAEEASGDYLWFLHADSILISGSIEKLVKIIREEARNQKKALYYFDLKFIRMSGHNVRPKEIGVLFRSRCLHTPFGDQGFFISRELFEQYGPYPVKAPYGEDHLFIRKLRRYGIEIKPTGIGLYTSPRKYEQNGWIRTTILHQYLWLKQAFEDWIEHKGEARSEYSDRNLLQDTGTLSRENAFGSSHR
jgi:glycosyltransferase involved in cell wall biosynthesis